MVGGARSWALGAIALFLAGLLVGACGLRSGAPEAGGEGVQEEREPFPPEERDERRPWESRTRLASGDGHGAWPG